MRYYRVTGLAFKRCCSRSLRKRSAHRLPRMGAGRWYQHRRRGCPPSDRAALARAFIAKAVFALVSTRMLLDRLRHDSTLRRLCGWRSVKHIPSEATTCLCRICDSALPSHLEALIKRTQGERLAGHISRDSTAIEGRERPTPKAPQPAKPNPRISEESSHGAAPSGAPAHDPAGDARRLAVRL